MNKKYILLLIVSFFLSIRVWAQNKEFSAANFPDKPLQLQQAQSDLNEGMKLFKEGEFGLLLMLGFNGC